METLDQFIRYNHILAVCEDAICKNSFELNLSRFEMKEVPKEVAKCSVLKLFLNRNNLKELPAFIGEQSQLCVLTLDYNKLTGFPNVIFQLTNLVELNISCNNITEIPAEIGLLINLEVLWCNNTGLRELPLEIGNCHKIETLGARGNKLTELPSTIGLIENLRWLTFESNEICLAPKSLSALRNLVHLNLGSNKLTKIPENIRDMEKLRFIFLNDNCIATLPSLEELKQADFIRMLNICDNPVCTDSNSIEILEVFLKSIALTVMTDICLLITLESNVRDVTRRIHLYLQCPYILYKHDQPANISPEQNEDDDEDLNSDWEHSVETSDLNTTDDDSLENNIEEVSLLIPAISRFATNSG